MQTPAPCFSTLLPADSPTLADLDANGWLSLPSARLPFLSFVAASTNDPLASLQRVEEMARQWGSELVNVGAVSHLNPASGFGPWKQADEFVALLDK